MNPLLRIKIWSLAQLLMSFSPGMWDFNGFQATYGNITLDQALPCWPQWMRSPRPGVSWFSCHQDPTSIHKLWHGADASDSARLLDLMENRRTGEPRNFFGAGQARRRAVHVQSCVGRSLHTILVDQCRSHAVDSPRTARASAPRPTVSLLNRVGVKPCRKPSRMIIYGYLMVF